jgi:hypothetical protein
MVLPEEMGQLELYETLRLSHEPDTWPRDAKLPLETGSASHAQPNPLFEDLPFFGPPDPDRWTLHKKLFLLGLLFPPIWFIGSWLPVKDSDDTCASYHSLQRSCD